MSKDWGSVVRVKNKFNKEWHYKIFDDYTNGEIFCKKYITEIINEKNSIDYNEFKETYIVNRKLEHLILHSLQYQDTNYKKTKEYFALAKDFIRCTRPNLRDEIADNHLNDFLQNLLKNEIHPDFSMLKVG